MQAGKILLKGLFLLFMINNDDEEDHSFIDI